MLMIETPGKPQNFKARAVAIIVFGESFPYQNEGQFYSDERRHRVSKDSPWAWIDSKPKWAWPIVQLEVLKESKELSGPKGIRFTTGLSL
jgi:hypothetical protein